MPAGGDWAVAFIILVIFVLLVGALVAVCHLCHFPSLTSLLSSGAGDEEKTVLTNTDHFLAAHYLKQNGSGNVEKVKDLEGLAVKHQYYNLAMPPEIHCTSISDDDLPQPPVEITAESPVSDTMSVVSDTEGSTRWGLRRASSFESVSSDVSVDNDVTSALPSIGQLEFGLDYDSEASQLIVSVIQARDLEKNDVTATLDSFVKLWLTPVTSDGRQQTKIQRGTTCPTFKERFLFNLSADHFDIHTLQLQVFSSDRYARIRLLGEAELRLGDVDIKQPIRLWLNLRNMDEKPPDYGSILFSLSYLPTAERITVVVVKARELVWPPASNPYGDCCVKIYLIQNGKKVSRKKTTAKKEGRNATFNEAMIFSVPAQSLQHVQLRVKVVDCGIGISPSFTSSSSSAAAGGSEQLVGYVTVGSSCSGTELSHWNQMLMSPRKSASMWHALSRS